jgi:ketopantoate reductase
LTLERPQGSISASAKAAAALTEPVDVLWITTNTYQLQTALKAVHSLPTCAVPLLPFGRTLLLITRDFSFEQFKEGVLG